jgi:DNA-binding response OmpR family regulator
MEPNVRLVLQEFLTDEGYEVVTTSDSDSFLKLLRTYPAHLAILQFTTNRPWEEHVIQAIRDDHTTKDLSVILLCNSDAALKQAQILDTATSIITEPYNIFEFLDIVEGLAAVSKVA